MKTRRSLTVVMLIVAVMLMSAVAAFADEGSLPNQIEDRQALADYFGGVQKAPASFDQIANRQALADYQVTLGQGVWTGSWEVQLARMAPADQIADRMALADYQAALSPGDYGLESTSDTMFAKVPQK